MALKETLAGNPSETRCSLSLGVQALGHLTDEVVDILMKDSYSPPLQRDLQKSINNIVIVPKAPASEDASAHVTGSISHARLNTALLTTTAPFHPGPNRPWGIRTQSLRMCMDFCRLASHTSCCEGVEALSGRCWVCVVIRVWDEEMENKLVVLPFCCRHLFMD